MGNRITRTLRKWRKMYDFLYTKAIGHSLPANYAKAGRHSQIGGDQTVWPHLIEIDDWARLQNNTNLMGRKGHLVIKKFGVITSGCTIFTDSHIPTVGQPQFLSIEHINDITGDVVVGEDAWVGASCILMPACEIGRGAVVGAGAIVTHGMKVPPYAVAVGAPARVVATRFTLEQILAHERSLYPPQERTSRAELEKLFATIYKGKKSIGTDRISEEDRAKLAEAKRKYGITDYSDQE